ncbi:MAG: hypothetical protein ACYDAD_14895 [Acidimicrobiales bacterium]
MRTAPTLSVAPPELPGGRIAIRPWPDPVIDSLGWDPRSAYVERFWLGILGPSTTWLLRRIAAGLEESPAGFPLSVAEDAAALGLSGGGGRHSPFMRALLRSCQFHLARVVVSPAAEGTGDGVDGVTMAFRRKLPPLNRRQVARLGPSLRDAHARWQQDQLAVPAAEVLRRRARRLALSVLELGEDLEGTERQLLRWRFHPALAQEASAWAWERHQRPTD